MSDIQDCLTPFELSHVSTCRDFAEQVLQTSYKKYDEMNCFAEEIHQEAFEWGILNAGIPKEYGGQGVSHLALIESGLPMAEVCAPTTFSLGFNHGTMRPILQFGSEYQKEKYVKDFVVHRRYVSWAMTEPEVSGSNLFAVQTRAFKNGNAWEISGEKCMIGNGSVASLYLVLAQAYDKEESLGLSVFLVPRDETVDVSENIPKLGFRCLPTPTVTFRKTLIPYENHLGGIGKGAAVIMDSLGYMRFGGGIVLAGLTLGTIKETVDFTRHREVLGGRLSEKSHVQIGIGRFLAEFTAVKSLLVEVGRRLNQQQDFNHHSAALKLLSSELAQRVTAEAVQIWGWRGIDDNYPIQKRYRDAKQATIYEGTSELLAITLFNNFLFSKPGRYENSYPQ